MYRVQSTAVYICLFFNVVVVLQALGTCFAEWNGFLAFWLFWRFGILLASQQRTSSNNDPDVCVFQQALYFLRMMDGNDYDSPTVASGIGKRGCSCSTPHN